MKGCPCSCCPRTHPDLNFIEGIWAHLKRSLADLAVIALNRLETLVCRRPKRLQCRSDPLLDDFIAGTGLALLIHVTLTSRSQ